MSSSRRTLRKVLIANRGEIACRVIRSCRELGLSSVAVYSDADSDALHATMADEAVHIGPARAQDSYLNVAAILDAMSRTGADGVHPGYGFLAENAAFASAVRQQGGIWIGPHPDTLVAMGDKERARHLARSAGVPVLPGSPRFLEDAAPGLESHAQEVGYPLLVKASAGGGGIGMHRVDDPAGLAKAVQSAASVARRAFGDATLYLEHYVTRARHIEVQIFGFGDGRVVHLFERECSIQRRFQKVIEEAPAPGLDRRLAKQMMQAAVALASAQGYEGAGTVEFILDAERNEFYFLEMNTRIQVEHPVTEMTTGLDLVSLQLQQAAGDDLAHVSQDRIDRRGHAIECRLYAEDPIRNFLPSPGRLEAFNYPDLRRNFRIDTGVRAGDAITPFYDPMVAKLIWLGADRNDAIANASRGLESIEVRGIKTNVELLKNVLRHPSFVEGEVDTGFIEAHRPALLHRADELDE